MKRRAGQSPNDDNEDSAGENPSATEHHRRAPCKDPKSIAHHAKEISRFFLFLKFFLLRFHCLGTGPSRRPRLYVLTQNSGSCAAGSLCQHDCPLTTENKTEHETNSERGKDRLGRVFADVLLAVVLKTADTMERIVPYLFRATEILIGHYACGRAEIFGRFARVRPATLCFLSRLR